MSDPIFRKPLRPDFEKELIWKWRRCTVKILVVADGGINFASGGGGFGLSELLTKALNTSGMPYVSFAITTAHRGAVAADIQNFKFDAAATAPTNRPFNNDNYDQVWMFGREEGPILPASELQAIATFMNKGGGVFATGDHENLGLAMCGEIPRVRSMRKWYFGIAPPGRLLAPPIGGPDRLDTHREGNTPGYQFADQSDEFPQVIMPTFFGTGGTTAPHPLLSKTGGVITSLPDHAHEGECVVPTNLTESLLPGSGDPEYPFLTGSGTIRVVPELVAVAASSGGQIDNNPNKPKVNPRCFGAIGAYNGHLAGVGRVVVDATWHHFLDINLRGTGSTPARNGLYDALNNPTPEYEDIKQYYRNIATYLATPKLQKCFRFRLLFPIRFRFPLVWEVRPLPPGPPPWPDVLDLGRRTRDMIRNTLSDADVILTATELLYHLPPHKQQALHPLVNCYSPDHAEKVKSFAPLLSPELAVDAILGGAMRSIVNSLPGNYQEAAEFFTEKGDEEKLEGIVAAGVNFGADALSEAIRATAPAFDKLSASLATK